MATKLILAPTEAEKYVKYLTGFASTMVGSQTVYLGLGNITVTGGGATFTEIPIDRETDNDKKTTNYARVMVKTPNAYPNVLKVDPDNSRRIYNHEQIVFNKVLNLAYTANAIALYREEVDGAPYAFGALDNVLNASVGSLPMFEREQLELIIPNGSDITLPTA